LARHILMELAEHHPLVQAVVSCPITQLDKAGVTLSLRVWCANVGDAKRVEFDFCEQERGALRKRGSQDLRLIKLSYSRKRGECSGEGRR
jgi:hypothetical protein